MTRFFLARHGETVWHDGNRYAGRTDVALTPRGRRQADRLGAWAAAAALDAVWASPLARARETAAPAASAAGVALQIDARLSELDFGRAEGLTVAEMEQRFPEALAAFRSDPVRHHLPGGEDPRAAIERGVSALEDLARAHARARVLVVAHTTLIRLMLCALIGVPVADYRRLFPFVRNVAITELDLELGAGSVSLLQYNAPLP